MSVFERDNLAEISDLLEKGGVIAYPTDTIWGIGCDALNPAAVERVSLIKERPADKTMILLVSSIYMLKEYVSNLHPKIETLLAYHERPITVIYDSPKNLPEVLIANDGTIAIRVVKDHFCEKLIETFGKPIISTSANVSGQPFPESFGQISSDILSKVDYVVKHRQADKQKNEPSLLIKMSQKGELVFLRR
jgi:L-threonylcarbamoyladenylate synthase